MDAAWDDRPYADVRDNMAIVGSYVDNMAVVGRTVTDPRATGKKVLGSTDMGNVSYLLPSIHPMVRVAPEGVAIHTEDFARYAGSDEGDRAAVDGASAMAMTVIDLWLDDGLRERAAAEFAHVSSSVDVLA